MPRSENGYSANDRSKIASYTIPGTTRKVALRKGDCAVVLLDFLGWFDAFIESIDGGKQDDWGYAERNVRGSETTLSNHASGTAVDVNATRHSLGKRGTFTKDQASKIRAKLKEYGGVIRWGGDYKNRADEMHFEINAGSAAVKKQADRIRAKAHPRPATASPRRNPQPAPAPAPAKKAPPKPVRKSNPYPKPVLNEARPVLKFGARMSSTDIKFVQWASGIHTNKIDGIWGGDTTDAVVTFQRAHGLRPIDGKVGKDTLGAMVKVTR